MHKQHQGKIVAQSPKTTFSIVHLLFTHTYICETSALNTTKTEQTECFSLFFQWNRNVAIWKSNQGVLRGLV